MKMLMNVNFPLEPFNTYVKEGSISRMMNAILTELKPEAVYFNGDGQRQGRHPDS